MNKKVKFYIDYHTNWLNGISKKSLQQEIKLCRKNIKMYEENKTNSFSFLLRAIGENLARIKFIKKVAQQLKIELKKEVYSENI